MEVKQIDWFDDHFYRIRYENYAKVEITDYFPSVTTKLGAVDKPFLRAWYGDLGTREAQLRSSEAADRGSRIHHAWYTFTTHGCVVYQPPKTPLYTREELEDIYKRFNNNVVVLQKQDEMWDMMKLQELCLKLKPTDIISEYIVYDIKHRDAGTVDNSWTIKEGSYEINGSTPLKLPGGRYIVDLKTGKSMGEGEMQVAAYMMCAESMGEEPYAGCLLLHTGSTTKRGIEGLSVKFIPREEALSLYQDYRDIAKVWERQFGTKKPVIRQIPGMIHL